MTDPIKFTREQDRTIINAACALARMAKQGKPVVFDMDVYAEVTLGITAGCELKPSLERKLSHSLTNDLELTSDEANQLFQMLEAQKKDSLYQRQKRAFVEALQDAFFNEAAIIQHCFLVEVGYGSNDWVNSLPAHANVFLVIPRPSCVDVTCLQL